MSTTSKKSLLLLGSLIVCSSAIFANSCKAFATDAKAGPIWNGDEAKVKCTAACTAIGEKWTGKWRTTVWGQETICGCK